MKEFYREWATLGAPAWYDTWWRRLEETRSVFGHLIGADAAEIAILPSVSSALAAIGSCFNDRARPNLLTTQLDFPTIPYGFMFNPRMRVRRIGTRGAVRVPLTDYEGGLDSTVAAVATSHVFYSTGAIQDVAAITRAAHKVGALSIIDSYHGAGQLPIDVKELGCDALISGGLKWLLGGPGCALMYVRRDRLSRLSPTITGWFANERQFEFNPEAFSFRPTGARFELGTPSLPSTFGTLGGMELVAGLGAARIRKRQNELVTDLYEKLSDAGYAILAPQEERERAGILLAQVGDAPSAVAKLAQRRIVVDARDRHVRVSPYFYNTISENDAFVHALSELAPPVPAAPMRAGPEEGRSRGSSDVLFEKDVVRG